MALAGGSTPKPVYARLAEEDLDWSRWHVWWSDERLVPPDHPDSNERMAREALLDRVPIPERQIHPLRSPDVELPDRFDLILLGVGPDGHCASLFPGDPALAATEPVVRVERPGLPPPHARLTFSYPVLNAGRTTAFLVSGREKRDVVARILAGDESLPAARVRAPETFLLVDEEAAPA
ncbi:MAG: 6-phosphogluconolactonase [Actinomycetota bacterium]|nr:6-phosphogluconolactonase [Actinomycetota bacterium]